MAGPLDRWLQRSRSQDSGYSNDEQRDQNTAEPPATTGQEHHMRKGTLHAYLRASGDVVSSQDDDGPFGRAQLAQRRPSSARCVLEWQATGRALVASTALLWHRHASALRQLSIQESHARQRPTLGGTPLPPEEAGCLHSAQFDSQGELLVAGSEEGLLSVHSTARLAAAGGAAPPPLPQQRVGAAEPLLLLDTGLPKLQAVRWNPADENVVGAVSSATRQLLLFDLQHTQGRPSQVLSVPQQSALAAGLTDLAFFGGGSGGGSAYVVLASGGGGQVFLWDARARAAPCAVLQAPQGGAINALQLWPDGQVVAGGGAGGDVRLWDLRGGACSALRFGGTAHRHPLLASVSLRLALAAVPGLARQTAIPASGVQSLALDPRDTRRLAFHLGCGWSGVLRLQGGGATAVTHLHAPAQPHPEGPLTAVEQGGGVAAAAAASVAQMLLWASTAAPALHRRACWMADGRRFCVPSRRDDSLLLLDFADSPAAGCYAPRGGDDGEQGPAGSGGSSSALRWEAPPAAAVPLSQAAVCVAAHPYQDLLVAGGPASCLAVAGLC